MRGEAVAIDLGNKGVLFALLDYEDYRFVSESFPGPPVLTPKGVRYYSNLKGKAVLDPTKYPGYPDLIAFKDITNPKSKKELMLWKRVDGKYPVQYRLKEDLFEEVIGSGVELKEITIEVTDEPVTWEIAPLIGEFGQAAGKYDRSRFIRDFQEQ